LAEPTEEAFVAVVAGGGVGAVEAKVELRSQVPSALEVAGEVVLAEFEGAGAIAGVEEVGPVIWLSLFWRERPSSRRSDRRMT
jgi:hypothetical protein